MGYNEDQIARAKATYRAIAKAVLAGSATALDRVGLQAVNEIKAELSHPGGGRTYQRGGGTHTASAPGDPPAVDTGRLRQSIISVRGGSEEKPWVAVGTNVEYAPYLEFGTRNIAPRPYIRPAIERLRQEIAEVIGHDVFQAEQDVL